VATILLIEDTPANLALAEKLLRAAGHEVLTSDTGSAGVALAHDKSPDLVLLDLGLPDVDGVEVTRRLREWTSIPIIVVSARGKEQDKVVALDAGADDYLTKPFGVAELLARVRVVLRHLAAVDPETGEPVFEVAFGAAIIYFDYHISICNTSGGGRARHIPSNAYSPGAA